MGGEKEIINGIYSDIQKLAYRDVYMNIKSIYNTYE